jgi:FkbM family methyltransferase
MPSLARSPIAPVLGKRVPLRGPARLLYKSYARTDGLPGRSRQLTTKSGDRFEADVASYLEWQLWAFGGYERYLATLFARLVRPGDRCIDVGANIGVHTIRLAKLAGPAGQVIAIEPDAGLAARARANIALNQLANVRLVQAAASRHGGEHVLLYRPAARDANKGRASLHQHAHLTGEAVRVPTVTVDELCAGPVALIKIDVEGHEAQVVAGAAAAIESARPAIVFEYAPELLPGQCPSPFSWLRQQGYALLRISPARHRLTGRGRLALQELTELPAAGTNILALPPALLDRALSQRPAAAAAIAGEAG